jgi:hypothetical protein
MSLLVLFAVALMKIEHLWQFSDTLTPVRVYRIARDTRLRRRVHPRPTGLVSAALPISAPSRLRVSRSDARGVTVLLVKGRSYAQPDPRAFADAILRRE